MPGRRAQQTAEPREQKSRTGRKSLPRRTSTGSLAADARLLHRPGIAEVRRVVDDTPAAERHQPHRPRRGDAALRRRRPAGGRPPPLATNLRVASTRAAASAAPPGLLHQASSDSAPRSMPPLRSRQAVAAPALRYLCRSVILLALREPWFRRRPGRRTGHRCEPGAAP